VLGVTNAALSTASAADRAAEAFALVDTWLSSAAMTALLSDRMVAEVVAAKKAAGILGAHYGTEQPEPSPAGRPDWVPSGERVPAWVARLLDEPGTGLNGVLPGQLETLRRALEIEETVAFPFNFRPRVGTVYGERSQLEQAGFSAETRAEILELSRALGLVSPRTPRYDGYAKTLVLGGGYRSPLLRARYAAQLHAAGVSLGELSFLGSPRFLDKQPDERQKTADFAPGATDEFGLMLGALNAEFRLRTAEVAFRCGCASADQPCPNWRLAGTDAAAQTPPEFTHERQAQIVDGGPISGSVLSASTGRPPKRPDTSDTFGLWARQADPQFGQRVLVITTQVFVPFQTFDGLGWLYLPYGVDVDTVGYGADWGDRPQTAEYLLQETLSAIRSGRRLLVRAAEVLAGEVLAR
jgi:hypothetical protein